MFSYCSLINLKFVVLYKVSLSTSHEFISFEKYSNTCPTVALRCWRIAGVCGWLARRDLCFTTEITWIIELQTWLTFAEQKIFSVEPQSKCSPLVTGLLANESGWIELSSPDLIPQNFHTFLKRNAINSEYFFFANFSR